MARTPAQALAWANSVTTGYSNLCLRFVREAYGIQGKYKSAIAAWNGAQRRHLNIANAPDGAPVFFSHPKSKYGHVALLTRINGVPHIRTTNSVLGRPATQTLKVWTDSYRYKFLGWTEDLNGEHVAPPVGKGRPPVGPPPVDVDGHLGPATIRRWQEVMGTMVDGVISRPSQLIKAVQQKLKIKADGYLGPETIKALQRYLGTTVDGVISKPSEMVKALQRRLNAGKF